MYRWVRGGVLFDAPIPKAYGSLGELTAQMHQHANGISPVSDPLRRDRVFYFPNEEYVIDDETYADQITARQRGLVHECTDAVAPILRSLYDSPGRLIHADLHGWNVNVYRGRLTVLDFDDVLWGQPVQDIAITFGYYRGHADYPAWLEAYEEGYRGLWGVACHRLVGRRGADDRPAPDVHQLCAETSR